jgi:hypothetical protein
MVEGEFGLVCLHFFGMYVMCLVFFVHTSFIVEFVFIKAKSIFHIYIWLNKKNL